MTDNLRDRIAKAIAGAVYGHNTLETAWADLHEDAQDEYFAEADAVIEALGLGKEIGCGCLPAGSGCSCSYRHCTTWSPCGTTDA